MGSQACAASQKMANTITQTNNEALRTLAASMDRNRDAILAANKLDIEAARTSGKGDALIDRLTLTGKRSGRPFSRTCAAWPDFSIESGSVRRKHLAQRPEIMEAAGSAWSDRCRLRIAPQCHN